MIRRELGRLNKLSDETSTKLGLCLVTSTVEYEPPFDVNAGFEYPEQSARAPGADAGCCPREFILILFP